jgi:plasmid stabilization system protein ParE
VEPSERALVVISSLTPAGRANLRGLYRGLGAVSVELADLMLRPHYGRVRMLTERRALRTSFVRAVNQAAARPEIKAIDVIVVLHGHPHRLVFDNGSGRGDVVPVTELGADLAPAAAKLRVLYSTACFGLSHAQAFVDAGFAAACGAIGQCANGPVEYPQVLSMWSQGYTFKDSVNKGDDPSTRRIFDAGAWLAGFHQANSDKEIKGNLTVTIDSLP